MNFVVLFSVLILLSLFSLSDGFNTLPIRGIKLNQARKYSKLFATTNDFKNGVTFELDGVPHKVMEFMHVKPGKGPAFVRTKIKNLIKGGIRQETFPAGHSITLTDVSKKELKFSYVEGDNYVFMDMETFEEERVNQKLIENVDMLKDEMTVIATIWNNKVIEVVLPENAEYEVTDIRSESSSGKSVILENGAVIVAPLFVHIGDKLIVSIPDKKYSSRVSKR